MSDVKGVEQLIASVTDDIVAAHDLSGALEAVTLGLRDRYQLWRSSVWRFVGDDRARLVARWSVGDTAFSEGLEVAFGLTPDVQFIADTTLKGRPTMMRSKEKDFGLLSDMLKSEGIESAVIVPIREGRIPTGILVLASSDPDAFRSTDVRMISAIAKAVGQQLAELLADAVDPQP